GGADLVAAGVEGVLRARPVDDLERQLRRDRDLLRLVCEQHPNPGHGRLADRRTGVVVLEDPVVRPAVLGVSVGAVLAQADAVAPAVAADEEGRLCADGRRRRCPRTARGGAPGQAERGDEDYGEGASGHAAGTPERVEGSGFAERLPQSFT